MSSASSNVIFLPAIKRGYYFFIQFFFFTTELKTNTPGTPITNGQILKFSIKHMFMVTTPNDIGQISNTKDQPTYPTTPKACQRDLKIHTSSIYPYRQH